jgi:hypothetical protein
MLYIVSTDIVLLDQQMDIFNNLNGFPIELTYNYTNILKHYQENKWVICFYNADLQYVIEPLRFSITLGITPDWYPPIVN